MGRALGTCLQLLPQCSRASDSTGLAYEVLPHRPAARSSAQSLSPLHSGHTGLSECPRSWPHRPQFEGTFSGATFQRPEASPWRVTISSHHHKDWAPPCQAFCPLPQEFRTMPREIFWLHGPSTGRPPPPTVPLNLQPWHQCVSIIGFLQ